MIYLNCDNLNTKIVIPSPVKKGAVDNFILTGADGSMMTAECYDVGESLFTYELTPVSGSGFDFSGVQPGEYNMTLRYGRTKAADLLVSLRTTSDIDIYYDEEKEVTRIPDYFIPYDNITGKPTFKTINGERIDNGPGNIVTAGADMEVVTIDKVITAQELIDADWNGYIITLPELEANKYYVLNLTYPTQDENLDPISSTINIEYTGIKTGASILEINQTQEGYGESEITIKFNNKDLYDDKPKFYNCTNSTYLQQPDYYPSLDIFNIGYGVVTRIPSNADTIEGLSSKLNTLQRNIDRKAEFREIRTHNGQFIDFYNAESKISYYSDPITQEEQDFSLPYSRESFYARFIFTAGPDLTNLHFINTDNSIDENVAVNPNTQYFAEFYFSYSTYGKKYNLQTTTLIPIGSASSGGGGGLTPEQVQQIIDQNTNDYATNTRVNEVENKIPTDTVTSAQLNAVKKTAESKTTMQEVEAKDYATNTRVNEVEDKIQPLPTFKTINGQTITDGPGDIEIVGDITSAEVDQRIATAVTPRNIKAVDQVELATVEIPTAGVTEERVNQLIDANTNGYQTAQDVESTITSKDYATNTRVNEVEDKIPTDTVTTEQLNAVKATAESKTTMQEVEAKDYATNTRVNEVEDKIPTDTVTSAQLDTVKATAESKTTMGEVDTKLESYTPTANFKTINGQTITDGPGNITIEGGSGGTTPEQVQQIIDSNKFTDKGVAYLENDPEYGGSWGMITGVEEYGSYTLDYSKFVGSFDHIDLKEAPVQNCRIYIKNTITDVIYVKGFNGLTYNAAWCYRDRSYIYVKSNGLSYMMEVSDQISKPVSEASVNQLIDSNVDTKLRSYTPTDNIKTINGQPITNGPGDITIKGGIDTIEYTFNRGGDYIGFPIDHDPVQGGSYNFIFPDNLRNDTVTLTFLREVDFTMTFTVPDTVTVNYLDPISGPNIFKSNRTYRLTCNKFNMYSEEYTNTINADDISQLGFVKSSNIKTINGESLVSESGGNIVIGGGGSTEWTTIKMNTDGNYLYINDPIVEGKNYILEWPEPWEVPAQHNPILSIYLREGIEGVKFLFNSYKLREINDTTEYKYKGVEVYCVGYKIAGTNKPEYPGVLLNPCNNLIVIENGVVYVSSDTYMPIDTTMIDGSENLVTSWAIQQELNKIKERAVVYKPIASSTNYRYDSNGYLNLDGNLGDVLIYKIPQDTLTPNSDTVTVSFSQTTYKGTFVLPPLKNATYNVYGNTVVCPKPLRSGVKYYFECTGNVSIITEAEPTTEEWKFTLEDGSTVQKNVRV